jgi:hypothetical protein
VPSLKLELDPMNCARLSLLPAFMEAVNEYSRNSLG